jgi:hypothetical protein
MPHRDGAFTRGVAESLHLRKCAEVLQRLGIINKTKEKPHQARLSDSFAFRNREHFPGGTTVALKSHGGEELARHLFSRAFR